MSPLAQRQVSQPGSQFNYPTPIELRPSAKPSSGDGSNIATNMIRILRSPAPAPPPGTTTIGRATDNDIVIPDVLASRHHATLVPSSEGVKILDARSINGTFVNGTRVDKALLREGDVVTIGNIDLIFRGRHPGSSHRHRSRHSHRRFGGSPHQPDDRARAHAIEERIVLRAAGTLTR